jgi:hypothetical protein
VALNQKDPSLGDRAGAVVLKAPPRPRSLTAFRSHPRLERTGHLPDENLVIEGHAFGIVFLKPPSAASESENTLTWSTSPTCLPGHVVLGRFHHTPLAPHAHIGKECPAVTAR